MRLIDDIRKKGRLAQPRMVAPWRQADWDKHQQALYKIICDPIPVILCSNVSDYYFSCEQEYWDLIKDFPNIAPPYGACWFEYALPGQIHSKEKGTTDYSNIISGGRVGVLMMSGRPGIEVVAENVPEGTKWATGVEMFIDYGHGHEIDGSPGTVMLPISAEGVLLDRPCMASYHDPRNEYHKQILQACMTWMHPALLAISFMHCRNVTVVDNVPDAKLSKRTLERHGIRPTSYKTLIIEPLKQILRKEGGAGPKGEGLVKAMHICRGHFKDYREGKGLFGKYHQLVWQPSLVRGTKPKGAPEPEREIQIKL